MSSFEDGKKDRGPRTGWVRQKTPGESICLAWNAIETSQRDAGWKEAIGICHRKATGDLGGSPLRQVHGLEGETAPRWSEEGCSVTEVLFQGKELEGQDGSPLSSYEALKTHRKLESESRVVWEGVGSESRGSN